MTHILKTTRTKKFVATILVTYFTIITEPDLLLQNKIGASQYDFCAMF